MSLPVNLTLYVPFLGAMAMMAVSPGPANTFAIAVGMQRGKRQALLAVLGMNSANLIWFAGAALGLGALMAAFPAVFHWLAILGALYVAWLGLKSILSAFRPAPDEDADAPEVHRNRSAFVDGLYVQLTNPKVLLFFTGVLPPFLDRDLPMLTQMPVYAATAVVMDTLTMSAYGLSGAALAARMTEPRFRRGFSITIGCLLIGVAILILLRG